MFCLRVPAVCLLLSLFTVSVGFAGADVFPVDHDKFPFYPSLFTYQSSGVDFNPPSVCSGCHPQQFEEWSGSVHALALVDPVYQGELLLAYKKAGHDVTRQCEGCHSAAGVVTGELTRPGLDGLSEMALAGVSCDVCHSVVGTTHWETPSHEPENGSLVLRPGIETADGPMPAKRGPFAPDEECGMGFHKCEESPLHKQADLCAGCHQVYHYDAHFPLEATYLEWKHGPYAQNNIHCQDCHMVETETFLQAADSFRKPGKGEYRHYFNGANYLLYALAKAAAEKSGDAELAANLQNKYEMAVKRLQAAAELEVSPLYRDGVLAELKVRVRNLRAGHNLPTSLTNIRQMWLEISARNEQGELLYQSGVMEGSGQLPENVRQFNSDGMGADLHFALDPWVITAFSRHDTIPPKGYKDVYYGLSGAQVKGTLLIEAKLRYRQADQQIAEKLLASAADKIDLQAVYGLTEVPLLPVVDMAVARVEVAAKQ
ncbi:MAG: multiheme c-type cytochrome [Desulfuromonadales bacterium]|nr:multiheme c-type cytochrome [Desulfuromonadales bacterium]